MPSENIPVSVLAKENSISELTLYTLRRNLNSQEMPVLGNGKDAVVWSSADKLRLVLKTARMNEAELSQYYWGKGLFVEQVADWREACHQAIEIPVERKREMREQVKSDRKEIKQL